MAKRREVSGNYRMEVTAKADCEKCFGTGIEIEQKPWPGQRRVEISLSVCMCVRVLPRQFAGGENVTVRERESPLSDDK